MTDRDREALEWIENSVQMTEELRDALGDAVPEDAENIESVRHALTLARRGAGLEELRDDLGPTAVIDSRGRVWTKGKRSFRSAYSNKAFLSVDDLADKFGPLRPLYTTDHPSEEGE